MNIVELTIIMMIIKSNEMYMNGNNTQLIKQV